MYTNHIVSSMDKRIDCAIEKNGSNDAEAQEVLIIDLQP